MAKYWSRDDSITDKDLIAMLLDARHLLTDKEAEAFESMDNRLKRGLCLTGPQRQWAEGVYGRLELEANRTLNLVSTGKVPKSKEVPTFGWERDKPLKPPGRR